VIGDGTLRIVPFPTQIPALLSLALVALASSAPIAFETMRYAEKRDRIRHI
jgi:hypothetical protein